VNRKAPTRVAVACGGTGGHLFPGLAVADWLDRSGCAVTLLISAKEVDKQAAKLAHGMEIVCLPAVGLARRRGFAFLRGFLQSWRMASRLFAGAPPQAVLGMGGFTSAAPILAGKRCGARTFLHESNTIPGRANRWLARIADGVFIGFPSAARRLLNRNITVTGTPVRPQFQPGNAPSRRVALGLAAERPVLLVMGGSQGASGINSLVVRTLPMLAALYPQWQWLHLTGAPGRDEVQRAYANLGLHAVVLPFLPAMELALGAATAAISRAGASSLAEIAAMRLPSLLIPYPAATDQHQMHNARAFMTTGAARVLDQARAEPGALVQALRDLIESEGARARMREALSQWHAPDAARSIANAILQAGSTPALTTGPKMAWHASRSDSSGPFSDTSSKNRNHPARRAMNWSLNQPSDPLRIASGKGPEAPL
jgi:UDP-N-acetylglucosamine--N-acetylmuramyl-(pentapeptide) pyrophosphoryl-undecaprenol N-acetylglucosamine transferase